MDHATTLPKEVLILRRADIDNTAGAVYTERTDTQLVGLSLAGDEAAFECIFDRHKRRVAGLASRFFREQAEVEEMVQISFTKAYVELASFRGAHEHSLASWLNRIAANTCLNELKRKAARLENTAGVLSEQEMETLAVDLRTKSVEELMVQRDLLEKLLASIDTEDRVLLQMLYAEQLSVAEAAEVFGWSRAKVKVRAFRARRMLNKVVKRFL
jgi:RNA polymerase sigma-70 factor, ECF subfamily